MTQSFSRGYSLRWLNLQETREKVKNLCGLIWEHLFKADRVPLGKVAERPYDARTLLEESWVLLALNLKCWCTTSPEDSQKNCDRAVLVERFVPRKEGVE